MAQSEELHALAQAAKEIVQNTTGELKRLSEVADTVKEVLPARQKQLKEEKNLEKKHSRKERKARKKPGERHMQK